ncbi:MAG TPA: hypothetical protein VJ464_03305 [Blastocatellia bacterium]|nr:hypothetical protein [Blastocatellia bacterium]
MSSEVKQMTDEEIRERIIRLGFDGDRRRFEAFLEKLREGLPRGTGVALRGSVITNERYADGQPFDADGKGTSDLDVTLIGGKAMDCWDKDEFYIPALHTKPLGDKAPHIAPDLNPLREELQRLAKRPVNFQATANIILFGRDVLFDEPYFILIEASEDE